MFRSNRIYWNLLFGFLSLLSCDHQDQEKRKALHTYVNPFIGTGGHGHTYPGATQAFGMVQLSPDTRLTGWDGCSGYHYSDNLIYGFSHTHLSGTGISDYGDILFMPFRSDKRAENLENLIDLSLAPSEFLKGNESAEAGYYQVFLDKPKVKVELTASKRIGYQKYSLNKVSNDLKILLDLQHRDIVLDYHIEQIDSVSIRGHRRSKAWAEDQIVYFYTRFSEPVHMEKIENPALRSKDTLRRYSVFKPIDPLKEITLATALSFSSLQGAEKNFKSEFMGFDFEQNVRQNQSSWDQVLSKIQIQDASEDKKEIFYTALYHTMIAPNISSDVDGSYQGMDGKIHREPEHRQYTVFSLWDTFRATHPLYTLLNPEETHDFLNSFLRMSEQGEKLPVWELASNETECMIGYHSVSVIWDAVNKGYKLSDPKAFLKAMQNSAEADGFGLKSYKSLNYVSNQQEAESVSRTLEYAYDDWCIAEFANRLGEDEIAEEYYRRAGNYKNLFDSESGFFRARFNAGWYKPFDPREVNFNYTEANAFQYSLFVPQDIKGLIELYGGKKGLEKQLDAIFKTESLTTGRHQADITGLIGQYAHGNEPSHHMAYLYNYADKPDQTQRYINQIKQNLYSTQPDGLSGNEDCGQMSAWYVFSSLGFYPVTPGSNQYIIGHPSFDHATVKLPNEKKISIEKLGSGEYIKKIERDGIEYPFWEISHEQILKGGKLTFFMTSDLKQIPRDYQINPTSIPNLGVPSPVIDSDRTSFIDKLTVTINVPGDSNRKYQIYYRLGQQQKWIAYSEPFDIDKTIEIEAYAVKLHSKSEQTPADIASEIFDRSKMSRSKFVKLNPAIKIELAAQYSNQYAADGPNSLIDKQYGGENFRTGYWQGFQGQDVIAIVDLSTTRKISSISSNYLQDTGSWIWFPSEVIYEVSNDAKHWTQIASLKNSKSIRDREVSLNDFSIKTNQKARYVRLTAKNRGPCPAWHLGAGGESWIFIDEFSVD